MKGEAHSNHLGVIILAAGASRRMGRPKQLLEYQGKTLLNRVVDLAIGLGENPIVVVLGAHVNRIRPTISSREVIVVDNPDWDSGMGSSIRTGLRTLLDNHPGIQAALVLLVDQPHLTSELLQTMIVEQRKNGAAVVAARYDNVLGVPALFDRGIFPELLRLNQQVGARKVIEAYRENLHAISFPAGAIDLDTPEDWERFRTLPPEHGE